MQGAWEPTGILTRQLFPGTSLYSGRDSMIFGGRRPSPQHGAHRTTYPVVCFFHFIWGHQHISHSQWSLFPVTGSHSLAPSIHGHHNTLLAISWARPPLPASGSSHSLSTAESSSSFYSHPSDFVGKTLFLQFQLKYMFFREAFLMSSTYKFISACYAISCDHILFLPNTHVAKPPSYGAFFFFCAF